MAYLYINIADNRFTDRDSKDLRWYLFPSQEIIFDVTPAEQAGVRFYVQRNPIRNTWSLGDSKDSTAPLEFISTTEAVKIYYEPINLATGLSTRERKEGLRTRLTNIDAYLDNLDTASAVSFEGQSVTLRDIDKMKVLRYETLVELDSINRSESGNKDFRVVRGRRV